MSTSVIDTLVTRFGFTTDTKGLDKAKKGLADFKSSAIKIGAAVGSIIGGGFFLTKIAESADTALKFADSIGVSVEAINALGFAVQRQGGNVDGLRSSLTGINEVIGEIQRGQGRAKLAFEDYGLSVIKANGQVKTADELLFDLNNKFTTLTRAQQFDLAKKMRIDQGTIKLLQTAPEALHDLITEAHTLGVLTRKDAESAAQFNDGLTNISQALDAVKYAVGGILFKPLSDLFKLIARGTAFIRKHSRFVKILAGIVAVLATKFIILKAAAIAGWAATFAPILIGIAAFGALALVLEDFYAYLTGQSSVLDDLAKKWPALSEHIAIFGDTALAIGDVVVSVFKTIYKALVIDMPEGFAIMIGWVKEAGRFYSDLGENIIDVFKLIYKYFFQDMPEGFKIMWGWLDKIGQGFIDLGKNVWNALTAPIDAGIQKVKDLLNVVKSSIGKIKSFFGFKDDTKTKTVKDDTKTKTVSADTKTKTVSADTKIKMVKNKLSEIYKPQNVFTMPYIPAAQSVTNNRAANITVKNITIDAKGGTPEVIAQGIGSALKQQLQNTVQDFDSGIAR